MSFRTVIDKYFAVRHDMQTNFLEMHFLQNPDDYLFQIIEWKFFTFLFSVFFCLPLFCFCFCFLFIKRLKCLKFSMFLIWSWNIERPFFNVSYHSLMTLPYFLWMRHKNIGRPKLFNLVTRRRGTVVFVFF